MDIWNRSATQVDVVDYVTICKHFIVKVFYYSGDNLFWTTFVDSAADDLFCSSVRIGKAFADNHIVHIVEHISRTADESDIEHLEKLLIHADVLYGHDFTVQPCRAFKDIIIASGLLDFRYVRFQDSR